MRLAFTSDLHVDHHPEVVDRIACAVRAARADLLVIAGDICARLAAVEAALARLADAAPQVAFVPGNHDLWCDDEGPGDSRDRYLDLLPALCARAGVACLSAGPLDAGPVTLVGQTGWYDYSLRDPAFEDTVPLAAYRGKRFGRLAWSDPHFIRWPGLDDEGLTAWMTARLARDLAAAPRAKPVVVVTHMLPFEELAVRGPLPWGFVRGFLGAASLGAAIRAAAADGVAVTRVIAGHTHFARRAAVDGIPCETSPIGYPREYARAGDLSARVADRVRVVEVA